MGKKNIPIFISRGPTISSKFKAVICYEDFKFSKSLKIRIVLKLIKDK